MGIWQEFNKKEKPLPGAGLPGGFGSGASSPTGPGVFSASGGPQKSRRVEVVYHLFYDGLSDLITQKASDIILNITYDKKRWSILHN